MALTYDTAVDDILSTLKVRWDADTPAITGTVPKLVYESTEQDLKPHPKDSDQPWARAVVRHNDANKVTLNNSAKVGRYRRIGIAWVQVFVPAASGANWTKAQKLAMVAGKAYEGKRSISGQVVFKKTVVKERPKDGAWFSFDVQSYFYWDEVK